MLGALLEPPASKAAAAAAAACACAACGATSCCAAEDDGGAESAEDPWPTWACPGMEVSYHSMQPAVAAAEDARSQGSPEPLACAPAAGELGRLQQEAAEAHNLAESLAVVNAGLREELDAAESLAQSRELAHELLKDAFFALQSRMALASAELAAARDEAGRLRRRLARAAPTPSAEL